MPQQRSRTLAQPEGLWTSSTHSREEGTIIDFILTTQSLTTQVIHPAVLPVSTHSDHMPLQLRALAPKRDKLRRRRLMEHVIWAPTWDKRVPTTWAPADPKAFCQKLESLQPRNLTELTEQVREVTKQQTARKPQRTQEHRELLLGLRQAPDTITRRAYQICLRKFLSDQAEGEGGTTIDGMGLWKRLDFCSSTKTPQSPAPSPDVKWHIGPQQMGTASTGSFDASLWG